MARARPRNALDRRADKLAAEMERRSGSIFSKLVDPAPAFMVHKNETDALRDYMRVRAVPGGLTQLREQFGDQAVDQYVAWGENALARHMPRLMGTGDFPGEDLGAESTENPSFPDEPEPNPSAPVGASENLFGPVSAEG